MSANFPNLDTPLGRAWLAAASIQQAVQSPNIEGDPMLKEEVARLAGAVKLLCEVVEQLVLREHTHGPYDPRR